MITEFYGELLVSPIPLELALNYCSHKCAYCFANLNKPDRTVDVKGLLSQLKNYPNQNNLTAHLLREKYPVLISNRVDPFAISNYQITLPVIETLAGLDIPVSFQTRGGKGIDEALQIVKKPTLWYISICQTDDAIRKQIEPGGSRLEERWELVAKLQAEGHNVVLGINPLVPEWIDLDILFEKLRTHNIKNVWIGRLHLNNDQQNNMSEREKQAIGQVLLGRAKKRGLSDVDLAYHAQFSQMCEAEGIAVYHTGGSHETNYFDIYHQTYEKTFPTMQGFMNTIWQTKQDGDLVRFSEFLNYVNPHLPTGDFALRGYIASVFRVYKHFSLPTKFSFTNLLDMFWNDERIGKNMSTFPNFSYAVMQDAETDELDYVYDQYDKKAGWWCLTKHLRLIKKLCYSKKEVF